jgi:hypothetical protein
MSTAKDKERAASLTGNIIITATIFTVLIKDIFFKMEIPNTFFDNRKKFKTYESQCRMYL